MNDSISSLPSTSVSALNATPTSDGVARAKKQKYDIFVKATTQVEDSLLKTFDVLPTKPASLFPEVSSDGSIQDLYNLKPLLERYGAEACAELLQTLHKEVRTCLTVSETYLEALEKLLQDACQMEDEGGLTRREVLIIHDTLVKALEDMETLRAHEQGVKFVKDFVRSMEEPEVGVANSDDPKTFSEGENLMVKLRKTVDEYAATKSAETTRERRTQWEVLLTSRNITGKR
ncbi:hypothetical protein RvY_05924-2 [Ramazzottius varieornatus]|uniref:Uncharacterized protein n=1 Tax=Ramazzottius varieornatus TaxID=947166 RepID=A0A1D1UX79_RAMVA|nr:hypothetical protein RvY_05924-2 [Ramazzottius varieornatus]